MADEHSFTPCRNFVELGSPCYSYEKQVEPLPAWLVEQTANEFDAKVKKLSDLVADDNAKYPEGGFLSLAEFHLLVHHLRSASSG